MLLGSAVCCQRGSRSGVLSVPRSTVSCQGMLCLVRECQGASRVVREYKGVLCVVREGLELFRVAREGHKLHVLCCQGGS